jgi:hypothetical protein
MTQDARDDAVALGKWSVRPPADGLGSRGLWGRIFDEIGYYEFVGAILGMLATSSSGMAQSHYDDQMCRQFADSQIAPLRDQVNSQAVGSALLGTGVGAAIGGVVGGARGAGIGAPASGAIVGGSAGAADA